jgi:uncharacterized protein (DUF2147 family)
MKIRSIFLPIFLLCVVASNASATDATPVGRWKTIDDNTHKPTAVVEISEQDGALSGRIVQLFRKPNDDQNPRCVDCDGERHDQPIIGMTILWNLHSDGDVWDGGEILDPDEGKTYRCKIHPIENGSKLEVRGFIGFSLLGRTQIWERADG